MWREVKESEGVFKKSYDELIVFSFPTNPSPASVSLDFLLSEGLSSVLAVAVEGEKKIVVLSCSEKETLGLLVGSK